MLTSQPDLVDAFEHGEITAWFQPQFEIASGAIAGLEALCRWEHPQQGFIPPSSFIPLAEESGLIDELGRLMTVECIDAIREWSTPARPLDVSVNVSPVQLSTPAYTDWLAEELARLGPAAASLTIEITESRPIDDVAAVVPRLDRLRALGLGIAIDDFGIGQASLKQLRRLHGTELKLDRSLVIDESARATDLLVRAVETAHEWDIRVVAEGIETERHLDRMRDIGCDRAQGYFLARPAPREEIARLLSV